MQQSKGAVADLSVRAEGVLPSAWVRRWADAIRPGGRVLDVAAGNGRHSLYLASRGLRVTAVDRDISALRARASETIQVRQADLEEVPWPFAAAQFDGIVVVNYLHRPLLPHLVASLAPDGLLIYETFMMGNARYGRPRNPDFLLQRNELLMLAPGALTVLAWQQGYRASPGPAMVQRLAARRSPAHAMMPPPRQTSPS